MTMDNWNKGGSVADTDAAQILETPEDFRARLNIDRDQQIKLVKLAHVRYQHPNLQEIRQFLLDFGFLVAAENDEEIWFKGYGSDPYVYYARQGPRKFLGATFQLETEDDLNKVAALPGAGAIEDHSKVLGGGRFVSLIDPAGFPVNFLFGQTPVEPSPVGQKLVTNYVTEKPRKRAFQRFQPGPAGVHKLGHFGFCTTQFEKLMEFYLRTFNITPTDFLFVPDDNEKNGRKIVGLFAHIDRGQTLVDHHTFFVTMAPKDHVHHSSFEVHDFDTQMLGHQYLASKDYKSVWGVGRHILGSQIFDYWWDTTGNMVEHYADGDLVNEDTPVGYHVAADEALAVWGPELPQSFLE